MIKNKLKTRWNLLFSLMIISFLIGLFFTCFMSKSDKNILIKYIDHFFKIIKSSKTNSFKLLESYIFQNTFISIFIWILGISLIGFIFIIFIILFKTFLYGFTCSSLFYYFGFKGLINIILYLVPLTINLFIFYYLSFFSLKFSYSFIKLILFNNVSISNKRVVLIKYFKVLISSLIFFLISNLFEIFIIYNLLSRIH